MSVRALQIELSVPLLGLTLLLAVTALASPPLLLALPIVWFLPAALRALGWPGPLDEREAVHCRTARELALSALLVLVCALPAMLAGGGDSLLGTLRTEWSDMGFLVLLVFLVRALVVGHHTLARSAAAHLAGGFATAWAFSWGVGLVLAYPDRMPAWIALLPLAALLPHALLAAGGPRLASLLWTAGAAIAAAYVLTAGFTAIEAVLGLGLLSVPWAAAAGWSWTAEVGDRVEATA